MRIELGRFVRIVLISVIWILILGILDSKIVSAQTFDPEATFGPQVGREKYERPDGKKIHKASGYLIPVEKTTIFIVPADNGIDIRMAFANRNFIYDIRQLPDSSIRIMVQDCLTRNCGDFAKYRNLAYPENFDLSVVIGDDSAMYNISPGRDADDPINVTTDRASPFLDIAVVKRLSDTNMLFVQFAENEKETAVSMIRTMPQSMKIKVLESGYYLILNRVVEITPCMIKIRRGQSISCNRTIWGILCAIQLSDDRELDDQYRQIDSKLTGLGLSPNIDYSIFMGK